MNTNIMDETLKALAKPPLDEEQQAIDKTIEQWTKLAETGEDKPELEDVPNNCYLCQYARKWKKGNESIYDTCKYCSYHKKYGHCNNTKGYKPYYKWKKANKADKRIHAAAFLAQVKTLRSKEMIKIDGVELSTETVRKALKDAGISLEKPEEAKPKLKPLEHGACMLSRNSKNPFLVWNDEIFWLGENYPNIKGEIIKEESRPNTNSVFTKGTFLFNLADDLKAMSEPLESFEVKTKHDKRVFIVEESATQNGLYIGVFDSQNGRQGCQPSLEEAEKISLKLRQAIATAKQIADKK